MGFRDSFFVAKKTDEMLSMFTVFEKELLSKLQCYGGLESRNWGPAKGKHERYWPFFSESHDIQPHSCNFYRSLVLHADT